MIAGITHQVVNGQLVPLQRLTVGTKVTIGRKSDKGYPEKDDSMTLQTKNKEGEWVANKELMDDAKAAYSKNVNGIAQPLRELGIILLSNDMDEVLHTELAWWSKSERRCSGNGLEAMRSAALIKDKAILDKYPGATRIPHLPCGDACVDRQRGDCKPSAALYFMNPLRPNMGSVCAYYTTSYRSILQIQSSLLQIMSVTGGRLRGIPLVMVLRPGKTRYKDKDGNVRSGTAFFINIEFRAQDHHRMIPQLLESSLEYEKARLMHSGEVKQLTAGRARLSEAPDHEDEIEPMPDHEMAGVMGPEFYPEVDDATEGGEVDTSEIDAICKAFNITNARRDVVIGVKGADATAWFKALATEFNRLSINASTVDQLFQTMGMQPDALLKHVQGLPGAATTQTATEPTQRRARRNKAQMEEARATAATETKPTPAAEATAEAKPEPDPKPATDGKPAENMFENW